MPREHVETQHFAEASYTLKDCRAEASPGSATAMLTPHARKLKPVLGKGLGQVLYAKKMPHGVLPPAQACRRGETELKSKLQKTKKRKRNVNFSALPGGESLAVRVGLKRVGLSAGAGLVRW